MGGPPRGQAPKSKAPLFIGLGCGGLALLVLVIGLVFAGRSDDDDGEKTSSKPVTKVKEGPVSKPIATGAGGKVAIEGLRFFKKPRSKTLYLVGELKNTGTAPLRWPKAKVTFYDSSKTALASTTCSGHLVILQPGESVPCSSLTTKTNGWKTYKAVPSFSKFSKYSPKYRSANLKISDSKSVAPSRRYRPHKVSGKVTNLSNFTAKRVKVMVGLYDAAGKIAGAGFTYVAGNDIEPGAAARYTVSIYSVATKVVKSKTKVFGYDK